MQQLSKCGRAGCFAEGGSRGALVAIQVADRACQHCLADQLHVSTFLAITAALRTDMPASQTRSPGEGNWVGRGRSEPA